MRYLRLYEGYWGDRYYWKVPYNKNLRLALSKIVIPRAKLHPYRENIKVPLEYMMSLIFTPASTNTDDDYILISYNGDRQNGDEWDWDSISSKRRLQDDNFEYKGEIKLEDYEKNADKYNI